MSSLAQGNLRPGRSKVELDYKYIRIRVKVIYLNSVIVQDYKIYETQRHRSEVWGDRVPFV